MQGLELIISIAILIMSVVIHEVSHGFAAALQGDPTAKLQGRLTLNPLKHLDPFGSVIVPLVTFLAAGFAFGWAKPVPYNPYNLKNQRYGELLVALAGPVSNLILGVVFGLIIRLGGPHLSPEFIHITILVVIINISLAVFNLIPIPPLDGSKVLFAFIPLRYKDVQVTLERYSLIILLAVIFLLPKYLSTIVFYLFSLLTGLHL